MPRLVLLLIAGLLWSQSAWAHTPILVDASISTDDDGVELTIEIKQSELLYAQHELRSLFRDRADFLSLQPQISAWLLAGISVTADGVPVALDYVALASEAPLNDPLGLHLHGKTRSPHHLAVRISLFQDLGSGFSVIDNIHWADGSSQAGTVKPGETVTLDVDATRTGRGQVGSFLSFVRLGFLHIVPEGLDHILFVLGLFLLSPRIRPLLTQVTAFTIAHSLTLGLSMVGILTLPARIVEPLIAASIAVVAIENLFTREVKPWRWIIVFSFGLVHGLGFAGALKDLHLPKGSVLKPLVGFNCGVEAGQLTVIAVAALATCWCWNRTWYRRGVIIPASAMIAAIGLFWAVQRGLGYGIEP